MKDSTWNNGTISILLVGCKHYLICFQFIDSFSQDTSYVRDIKGFFIFFSVWEIFVENILNFQET